MDERFHIILTESSGVQTLSLARLLPDLRCSIRTDCVKYLDQSLINVHPDAVICSTSEREVAVRVFSSIPCAILLLGTKAEAEACLPWAIANGVLCGDRELVSVLFPQLLALCHRLRSSRVREYSLQRKLTDAKLVNRAKLLLVTRLQMSEAEAHRYIEKTAMDNGESRRDVALRLIRTYEE